jgi:transcriptional regulator with XRE-family HTH domain
MRPASKLGMTRLMITGQTAAEVAAGVNIKVSRYRRIESGATPPTVEEVQRIADFFGVSTFEIGGLL